MSDAPHDWRSESACLDEDPDLFFPDGVTGAHLNQMKFAMLVCHRCPVQFECLQVALSTGMVHGVWGGTTPEERRSLQRRSSIRELRLLDARGLAELRRSGSDDPVTSQQVQASVGL